jgi:hypothetical protein
MRNLLVLSCMPSKRGSNMQHALESSHPQETAYWGLGEKASRAIYMYPLIIGNMRLVVNEHNGTHGRLASGAYGGGTGAAAFQ